MNRLLINMKNKNGVIDGAIDMCKRLLNNETITLNGLHTFNITKGETSDDDLNNRIKELRLEKENLYQRVSRFGNQ